MHEELRGLPVLTREVGPARRRQSSCTGTWTSCPGATEQFEPQVEGDRIYGRGAYDMKGALAAMLGPPRRCATQERVRVRLGIVPDEESEEEIDRGSEFLVNSGFIGDFAITGEPTDLQVGVQAKGVLAMRLEVSGVAAHGATPWLGDNAILKAHDVFRGIESLPFARHSSSCSTAPRSTSAGFWAATRSTRCPTDARSTSTSATCPTRTRRRCSSRCADLPTPRSTHLFTRPPAIVDRDSPFVRGLREAVAAHHDEEPMSVGRDGASDAVSFLRAGVPAVEFGPVGEGHHGPAEWVSVSSLEAYRQALGASCGRSRTGSSGAGRDDRGAVRRNRRPRATTSRRRSRSATGGASPRRAGDRRRDRRRDRRQRAALHRKHRQHAFAQRAAGRLERYLAVKGGEPRTS